LKKSSEALSKEGDRGGDKRGGENLNCQGL